jgi:trehalose 6-phosphate synthase
MRILSLRLIVALILGITLVSLASSWYEVRTENDAMRLDLERKALTLGESLGNTAESYQQTGNQSGLEQMSRQFTNREQLRGNLFF